MKTIVTKQGKVIEKLNIFDKIDNKLEGNKVYDFYYDHIWCPIWKIFYFYPKEFIHNTRMFFQRGRLGYTHEDYWGFNYNLAKYLAGVLQDWANNGKSFPSEYNNITFTAEEWDYFLSTSAEAFQEYIWVEDNDPYFEKKETKDRYDRAMKKIRRFFLITSEMFETMWD